MVENYTSRRTDLDFIQRYCAAQNAASGSEVDANSNVYNKNIATMAPEIHKKDNIAANRLMMHDYLTKMYGQELADEYLRQLESHEIYRHDESGMPVGTPYTYSGKEAIVVYQHGEPILTSLENLYDRCDAPEVLVDEEKMVFQKYPDDLYVADKDGRTRITALTKKKRHVDLVLVKTKYGENVMVTSNHPMIISQDIANTVEAKDALGHQQYRISPGKVATTDQTRQQLSVPTGEKYRYYTVCKSGNYSYVSKPNFNMDGYLGYFLGFFIAEGWYKTDARNGHTSMLMKVKGDRDLHACADALFLSTGIAATVSGYEDERGFKTLTVTHPDFVRFCIETLDLGIKASEKKLPRTIFQYSDEFQRGLICGLVDGDGTEHNGRFLIRLASRTCISQLASVLHHLNVPVSMSYTDNSEKEGCLIQSCYPMFSIEFPQDQFTGSRKYNPDEQQKFSKYEPSGWVEVTNVIPVTNKYYLRDSNYIYDITTETHTFVMNNLWVHNCASITLYPFLFDGMTKLGGTTTAPQHLQSFLGGFVNLVFAVSAQLCGAVATPEFLAYMDYFIRKEYGDQYYLTPDRIVEISSRSRTIDEIITDGFAQVVYSLNQPAAARGSQSVFWNIAYFDSYYFDQLFDGFVFPDGTEMQWKSVSWLQKRFMKWFNAERLKNLLTFPVETLSLLNDGEKFCDQEWADFAAEMLSQGHSFFIYTSNSVDSLASCCFDGDTPVLAKSSNGVYLNIPIRQLHEMPWSEKKNLTVYHNGSWVSAKTIMVDAHDFYDISTSNHKTVRVTGNHLWPTLNGLKRTDELTTDDWLMFNTRELDAVPERDRKLSYLQGRLIGMYLGDGSMEVKDGKYKTVHFSLNHDKYVENIGYMNAALIDCGIEDCFTLRSLYNNVYPVSLYGTALPAFIDEYVDNGYASEKRLKPEVFLQSSDFRRGILDGMYATDGGNSNRIYTTSELLARDLEALCTTLGINTIIDVTDRTDEPVIIRDKEYTRNHPLWCVRWYDSKNKRSMGDVYKIVNNSMYFRITEINKTEDSELCGKRAYCFECKNQDEPYFTLPNGMITHNCRLRNGLQDNQFSYTLGAGGVATGSKCVMTIDINRLVQNVRNAEREMSWSFEELLEKISEAVTEQLEKIHRYLLAFNRIVLDMRDYHMLSVYDAGFVSPEKQYLTIGVNGLVEGAEALGIAINDNDQYAAYVNAIMEPIFESNKAAKTEEVMFNTEMVPKNTKTRGHLKPLLIDLEIPLGQQGASVMAA